MKNLKVKNSFWGICKSGLKVRGVFNATNLKLIVLAFNGSKTSISIFGSEAINLASVSGSSKFLPIPSLIKLTLSYLESSLL